MSLRPQEAKKPLIPYGRQQISEDDIDRVNAALRSAWLTQGPMGPRFERSVAKAVDAAYGVATNSATSALHVACLSIGLGKGDLLWTSPNTFVASSNCGLYCGADVDFVDIDPQTYNMSAASLEAKLVAAQAQGRLPTVVVVVHYAGQSCEMEAIHALSQKYGFRIIEDASHAIGGRYQGNAVGSCQYSDMCVFSFHPVKIVTTGEGGMIVTNDPDLAERLVWHRSHGITNTPDRMQERPEGEIWNYQQIDCGYNYRLTDLQAALGLSQLDRLEEFVSVRHEIAARYDEALADLPIVLPHQHRGSYSAYHLYPIRVSREMSRKSQHAAYRELLDRGIGVNLHYIPVYLQPFYADLGFERGHCPEAEVLFQGNIEHPDVCRTVPRGSGDCSAHPERGAWLNLALGTAQFGSNYGIANVAGQVMESDVAAILDEARRRNVTIIDTAIAYGQSEMVLGKAGVSDFQIVSKIPPLPDQTGAVAP